MPDTEDLNEQIKKIKEILIKADEKLLAGEISEEAYKKLTEGKLEMLKSLESKMPPPKSREEINKIQNDLEELKDKAYEKISYRESFHGFFWKDLDPVCPYCKNITTELNECKRSVRIREHDLAYGFYCYSDKKFHE